MVILVTGSIRNLKYAVDVNWRIWIESQKKYYYDLGSWDGQPDGPARGPYETVIDAFTNLYKECIRIEHPSLYQ